MPLGGVCACRAQREHRSSCQQSEPEPQKTIHELPLFCFGAFKPPPGLSRCFVTYPNDESCGRCHICGVLRPRHHRPRRRAPEPRARTSLSGTAELTATGQQPEAESKAPAGMN